MTLGNPGDCGLGDRIGRYRVLDRLGKGAMGEVYLCEDKGLGRKVAVKVLSEAHRYNDELRARFVREARSVARIVHPNVVQIYFIDDHEGLPFFAMEYLEGLDLGSLLAERGRLADIEAVEVLRLAAEGLRAAADVGVVHRDVKPANIILTKDGRVKLTDFGLAKTYSVDPELTAAGIIVGTPDYISPEQARGERADSRSDIYGLGCTLFHLVSGRPPFRSDHAPNTYMAVMARHLHDERPDLIEAQPGTDLALADICRRMMARDPGDRPGFSELLEELAAVSKRIGGRLPAVRGRTETDSHPTAVERRVIEAGTTPPSDGAIPPSHGGASSSIRPPTLVARTGLPGWVLVVTALSMSLFLVGLGLRLSSARETKTAPALAPLRKGPGLDAGMGGAAQDAGVTIVGPSVPWTTVFVPGAGSDKGFYVSARPVSMLQWRQAGDAADEAGSDPRGLLPVTSISFDSAQRFARKNGGRLPKKMEWDRIRKTAGVLFPDPSLWEWVSGSRSKSRAWSRDVRGRMRLRRRTRKYSDVTFRIVWDVQQME